MNRVDKKCHNVLMFIFLFLMIYCMVPVDASSAEKTYQNSIGMTFTLIPSGTFMMGSPASEPHRDKNEVQHKVTISKPFYMQTTELTRQQYQALMGRKWFRLKENEGNMPMVKISWFDAVRFIEKLNELKEGFYRLPTEAEWEYAGRAGSQGPFFWGDEIDCSKAMFSNNSMKSEECVEYNKSHGLEADGPAPVKSYPPNAWGLYDMHGNVWEWCEDWYGPYPRTDVVDPKGPESGEKKVRRGGSWFGGAGVCRSANRNTGHPATKYRTLGFRVVMEVQ